MRLLENRASTRGGPPEPVLQSQGCDMLPQTGLWGALPGVLERDVGLEPGAGSLTVQAGTVRSSLQNTQDIKRGCCVEVG